MKDLQARHTEAKSQLDITKQELKKVQKVDQKIVDYFNIYIFFLLFIILRH